MGAWGIEVWENDAAADLFATVMEKVDTQFILDLAKSILKADDRYDEARAIAYIIATLGKHYIWPIEEFESLESIKLQLITYLEGMLDENSEFMEVWENDEEICLQIRREIQSLKKD